MTRRSLTVTRGQDSLAWGGVERKRRAIMSGVLRGLSSRTAWLAMAVVAASLQFNAAAAMAQAGQRRVAFVVGNSAYESVPKLANPDNDAEAVAAALKRSGFEVVTALDLNRPEFDKAFEKFIRSLDGADLSLFYYSGHGMQVDGANRIIPVDAKLKSAADLEVETVSVETVMSYMRSNSKIQLVYLDSCRNNPFPSQTYLIGPQKQAAAAGVGLAPQTGALGSLVAFSTQPGAVAVDGTGDMSPFTESMIKQSFKLGVDVHTALSKVTDEVWAATHERQRPWMSDTLAQPVYLAKPVIMISAAQPAAESKQPVVKIGSATTAQDATTVAASSAAGTTVQVASLLEENFNQPRRVPIGVGQVAILGDFPVIRAATGAQIEIGAAPKSGVMYLDGKPLGEGDVIDQAALGKVTFEPSIGSEDKIQSVEFKVSQAGSGDSSVVTGKIEPFMVPCDREAGEPLDLQGVGAGKLPNEIDATAAIPACQEAVKQFPTVARYKYELGRAKLAAKDVPGATEQFNAAAEAGHVRAFYELGYLAQRGLGRSLDLAEANRLFKVGADQGDPYAMLSFGRNLAQGRGVEKNLEQGVSLMTRAVELGHTYAMNAVGAMYYYGEGLKSNPQRGVRFYEAALARGDIYAMRNLGIAYLDGKGVARDPTTALALFKKASEGGHPGAPTSIGAMYFNGNGVKKDLAEAIKWYELGTERGDFQAASNLAWIYGQGPAKLRNGEKAAWYASLAVGLDVYGENPAAKTALRALPSAAKKQTMKKLAAEVGNDNLETSASLDETLALLARKAWQLRNPRLDLF